MTELIMGIIILGFTTLLLCWIFAEYQIYTDEHSAEEELHKPRLMDRIGAWEMSFWNAVEDARRFPQETLREKNKTILKQCISDFRENIWIGHGDEKPREGFRRRNRRRMSGNL